MKQIGKLTLILLWILLILAGYYVTHKPISAEQLLPSLLALTDLLLAGAVLAVLGGTGRWLMCSSSPTNSLAALAVQTALGAGLWSLVWLALGLLGLLNSWVAVLVLFCGLILLRQPIRLWADGLSELRAIWGEAPGIEKFLLLSSAVLTLNQLWIALAPPVKFDALSYHLALPRLYLAAGRFYFIPVIPYWGHPQLAEMLYTWNMALGRPETAAVFSWLMGAVMLLGILGFSRRFAPHDRPGFNASSAGIFAVAAVLCGATARLMLGWSYIDLFSALFGLASLICFFRWLEEGTPRWFLWVGLFLGFAISVKYTSGLLALVLFPAAWLSRGIQKMTLKTWLTAGLLTFAAALPWLLKNVFATGNPLFPYFLPSPGYSALRLAMSDFSPPRTEGWQQLFAPITLTWLGIDSAPSPGTDLGPLLVLMAAPGLLIFRRSSRARLVGASLLAGWVALALGGARFMHLSQPRLFYVILPALAAAAGWGWASLQTSVLSGVRLRRLLSVLTVLVMALVLWQDAHNLLGSGAIEVSAGLKSSQAYLEDQTGVYIAAMESLKTLPPTAHVLMLWEARSLYAPQNVDPDPWIDQWRVAWRETGSNPAVLARWREQGYTHILLYRAGFDQIRSTDLQLNPADWAALDLLLASLPQPTPLAGGYYDLYRLP